MRITRVSVEKLKWIARHPETRRQPFRVFWGLMKWEFIRIRGREAHINLNTGLPIRVSPRDGVGRLITYFGQHDFSMLEFLNGVLRKGDTLVDVGANIGNISIHAASLVSNEGKIIAFEPNPDVFERLESNVESYDMIECRQMAIGQRDDTLRLLVNVDSAKSSVVSHDAPIGADADNVVLVPTRRLDAEVSGHIRVLKIDVEGNDLDVLIGADGLMRAGKIDIIITEASERREDVIRFVEERGFEVFALCEDGRIRRGAPWFGSGDNLVALHSRCSLPERARSDMVLQ